MSRDVVYASALGGDPCQPPHDAVLDDATVARIAPIFHDEIKKGGLRLARLLDEALT